MKAIDPIWADIELPEQAPTLLDLEMELYEMDTAERLSKDLATVEAGGLPDAFVMVTDQKSVGGAYFAILMTKDDDYQPEMGGMSHSPWNTGIGRYSNREDAIQEGKEWAEAEDVLFIENGEVK